MRFFLDNNLAPRHAEALQALLGDDHRFVHLRKKFPQDAPDEEWLAALGSEGDWIVLSGDYRITRNPALRAIWRSTGLTAFFLTKGWMNLEPLLQHIGLLKVINRVIALAERHPEGKGFTVTPKGKIKELRE